jgi:hypothetical protein
MQLMSAGQITDHNRHVILDPDFCYIQDRCTGHLVGSGPRRRDSQRLWELDWLCLPLRPLVLPVLLLLPHPRRHFISGIIVWVIFVDRDYLL